MGLGGPDHPPHHLRCYGTSAIIARLMSGFGESGSDQAHEREHERGPAGTARLQAWDQRGDRQVYLWAALCICGAVYFVFRES